MVFIPVSSANPVWMTGNAVPTPHDSILQCTRPSCAEANPVSTALSQSSAQHRRYCSKVSCHWSIRKLSHLLSSGPLSTFAAGTILFSSFHLRLLKLSPQTQSDMRRNFSLSAASDIVIPPSSREDNMYPRPIFGERSMHPSLLNIAESDVYVFHPWTPATSP